MRTLALALLAVSASAQPVRPLAVGVPAAPSPLYRAGTATVVGGIGALTGGGLAALGTGFVILAANECGFDGCPGGHPGGEGLIAAAFVVGGVVGSTVFLRAIGEPEASYRGIVPYHGIGRDDWRRGLVGSLVGSAVGLGVAVLLPTTEGGTEWLAVPVAQGLGAGLAISVGR